MAITALVFIFLCKLRVLTTLFSHGCSAPIQGYVELGQATILSHRQESEVKSSHARTVVSTRFSDFSSPLVKRARRS